MAEDTFINIIKETHDLINRERATRGMGPYPFVDINPPDETSVLASLETTTMERIKCACGCGNFLPETTLRAGRSHLKGHKKYGELKRAVREAKFPTTPTVVHVSVSGDAYREAKKLALLQLETEQTAQGKDNDEAQRILTRIAVRGTKIEKLNAVINSLDEILTKDKAHANHLPCRTDGRMQRQPGPQLAEPSHSPVKDDVPYLEPDGAGLPGQTANA